MKLNPDELVVSSFETSGAEAIAVPTTIGTTTDPTPMTRCYWCPPRTVDCPIYTEPQPEPDPGTTTIVGTA